MRNYLYRTITDQNSGFAAGVLRFFLWLLSLVYSAVVTLRNLCFERGFPKVVDLGEPVISVGNLTWGGVGKTPLVQYLAGYLQSQGFSPAILTRGYMKTGALSDEAEMFRQELPGVGVGVGSDRVASAQKIKAKQPVDIFILDDGFQHRRVKRDLDIVLIDVNNPFGNGQLIPRGILREPHSALRRASLIVLTKTDANPSAAKALEERLKRNLPSTPIAWAVHQPQAFVELLSGIKVPLSGFAEAEVMSFCSIGDPEYFAETLAKLGIKTRQSMVFDDHHMYTENDVNHIIAQAQKVGVASLMTTAKDAVKMGGFKDLFVAANLKCWVLKVQFEIEVGKEQVLGRVHHLLGR
jgi:tetraacyldisaccharide 4'-kinase